MTAPVLGMSIVGALVGHLAHQFFIVHEKGKHLSRSERQHHARITQWRNHILPNLGHLQQVCPALIHAFCFDALLEYRPLAPKMYDILLLWCNTAATRLLTFLQIRQKARQHYQHLKQSTSLSQLQKTPKSFRTPFVAMTVDNNDPHITPGNNIIFDKQLLATKRHKRTIQSAMDTTQNILQQMRTHLEHLHQLKEQVFEAIGRVRETWDAFLYLVKRAPRHAETQPYQALEEEYTADIVGFINLLNRHLQATDEDLETGSSDIGAMMPLL